MIGHSPALDRTKSGRDEGGVKMLRSLLTFAALVAAHAAASFATVWCFAFTTAGELIFWVMFIPMHLLGQTREGHPDLGALVGVPENSPLGFAFFVTVNSLLWVACAYGLWLAGGRAWRKVMRGGDFRQAAG
jgi:hypothetical protein